MIALVPHHDQGGKKREGDKEGLHPLNCVLWDWDLTWAAAFHSIDPCVPDEKSQSWSAMGWGAECG